MSTNRTFGKRTQTATHHAAPPPRMDAVVVPDSAPNALTGIIVRFLARVPWFTLVLSYALCARFATELKRATDYIAPYAPGHFTLLAMGASDRAQVLGQGEWWRLFTATVLHGSPAHLIGNLVTLLIVGFLLEPMIGIGWFAAIYFTGGFAGACVSMLLNGADTLSVGASGAIMATLAVLFTLSFHAGAARPRLMRRVAGGSLFPALMPAVAGAGAVIDVNAHLGGCLAGAAIAFVLLIVWNDEEEILPYRSLAAGVAGFWVAMTIWAFAASTTTFVSYAKPGLDFIPPAEMPKNMDSIKADSLNLVDKYPKDPRAHMLRGLYLLEQRHVADAEPYFRDAARIGAASPAMTRDFENWNLALLALTVRVQNRGEEAKNIAAPLCANTGALDQRTRQTLDVTKLCR